MHPTLFTFGPIAVSSFGFFLALAFLSATFIAWRLAKAYDLNEEKVLDLSIITFFGGLIGARLYFFLSNWQIFLSWEKFFLINLYPGLSLWGGILGGTLTLWFFSRRLKLNFWQITDFASVSFLLGLTFGNLGCFLGGCNFGAFSSSPLSVSVVGLVGKRLPLPLFEGLVLFIIFIYLWKQIVKFHFSGKIMAVSLMMLGFIKFAGEFFRGDDKFTYYIGGFSIGYIFSILLFIFGILVFYHRSKRILVADLRFLILFPVSAKKRQLALSKFKKTWYNYQVHLKIRLGKTKKFLNGLPKFIKRRLNVKPTPKNIIEN